MRPLPGAGWLALCTTFHSALAAYHNWTTAFSAADGLLANFSLAQIANITAGQDVKSIFTQTPSLDGQSVQAPHSARSADE
jgi:hypothetical protein